MSVEPCDPPRSANPLSKRPSDPFLHLSFLAGLNSVTAQDRAGWMYAWPPGGPGAGSLVAQAETVTRSQLGGCIYGADDDDMETVIVRALSERRETLALAESCTGGLIAHSITNVPGASAVLLAGIVCYSNESKIRLLGVDPDIIAQHGAVSEACCRQMAEGALKVSGATFALAVTGIAGPSGGTPQKPVGTVFIGLAGPFHTVVERRHNPFDRETFKQVTVNQALNLLRRNALCPNG